MLRIKKLERELATSNTQLATSNMLLGQATEDIDTLEAEKQAIKDDTLRMLDLKDRIIKELEADQRGTSIPNHQGSGNESGGEGNQQLRAKNSELQERFVMLEEEILSLKRAFAHNQNLVESRTAGVYSDLVAFNGTINKGMKTFSDLIKDEMKALSGMFSGVDDKLSVFSSTAEEELKAFCREAAEKLKSVGAKTRPGKDEKADGKDMVRPGEVLLEKVPRSSAETELLRLKDRRTLHRLASM